MKTITCSAECLACLLACEKCSTDCIMEGRKLCAILCRDCADICALCARLETRGSRHHKKVCELCAEACRACAEECSKHAAHHNSCKECEKACLKCATICTELSKQN
ncbi:MAG: four-helix bundle copper-binding protein [Cyclobacteriaceae bacterium]|nr:four-helix bundle copper-binding protein [Cyclobacteriaceae bacterium]